MKNKRWIYYIIVVVVVIVAVSLGIGIANFGMKTTADKTNTKEIQETKMTERKPKHLTMALRRAIPW